MSIMNADLVTALAAAFTRELRKDVCPAKMAEIARRNAAENDSGICHSHDFIDANDVMYAAFMAATGRDPLGDDCPMTQADADLWNAAWAAAKAQWQ